MILPNTSPITGGGKFSWGGLVLLLVVGVVVAWATSKLFKSELEVYSDAGEYLGSGSLKTSLKNPFKKDDSKPNSQTTTSK